jgi:predicted GH43/DUF377 family glycosyl hydrolase
MTMNPILSLQSIFTGLALLVLAGSAHAADISFAGYLLNRADWRDATTEKIEPSVGIQGDLEGDQILGSSGYVLFGPSGQDGGKVPLTEDWASVAMTDLPSWIQSWRFAPDAEMARFPGYAEIDHPEQAVLKLTSGALVISGNGEEQALFELTFGEAPPETVRIGFMVDNMDQGVYNTHSFRLVSDEQTVGPIVTLAQSGSTNGVPDFYFFDVSRAKKGDKLQFFAQAGPGSVISLGAVTLDAHSSSYYSEFSHPGRYLKDFFVYKDGDTYHLFYNIGLADGKQEWQLPGNEEMFGHATSTDLKDWEYHPGIMITQPLTWEEATVSAPTIVKRGDTYWMAYTGFDREANQRMGLATSTDLFNWERYEGNPLDIEPEWTSWQPQGWADFRDPHLLEMPDGYTYVFNTVHVPNVGGAVAVARSKDLLNWEDLGKERAIYPGFHPAESVHAFEHDGKVYAFIGGGGHALMATDDLLSGEWEKLPFVFPKAGFWSGFEVVEGPEGQMLVCAFQWKMHGNFIRFWEVDWDGDLPVLKQ